VIFFVISGFVIAYVVSNREQNITQYAAARFGRLYSVVIPSLILTFLLDTIGRHISPELYYSIPEDHKTLRLLINFLFIQQNWNLTVIALSNGPYWSLGYEFWYYVIFGAATFSQGRMRIILPLFFCICAGPRIVAFFPLWLLGVISFRVYNLWKPSQHVYRFILLLTAITIFLILGFGNPLSPLRDEIHKNFTDNYIHMGFLNIFLGDIPRLPEDMLLGALFGLMILNIRDPLRSGVLLDRFYSIIRYMACSTFSIYLFHAPLLIFLYTIFKVNPESGFEIEATALFVFICCIILSYIGERQVIFYRRIVTRILNR
jgi:peptidoglycan/LPS O-acetylase OafA/YrhL